MGGVGGRKGKGKIIIFYLIFKKKLKEKDF